MVDKEVTEIDDFRATCLRATYGV